MERPKIFVDINAEWHYAPEEPEKSGTFWAVTKYGDLNTKMYTPEGGWNTFNDDGVIEPNPDRVEWATDYIRAWTYDKLIAAEFPGMSSPRNFRAWRWKNDKH